MTGPATSTIQILVDRWPDDGIEENAYVEVTMKTRSPGYAISYLESHFPTEDMREHHAYSCRGRREWWMPSGEPLEGGKFRVVDPLDYDQPDAARTFTDYEPDQGPWERVPDHFLRRGRPTSAPGAKEFWVIDVLEER